MVFCVLCAVVSDCWQLLVFVVGIVVGLVVFGLCLVWFDLLDCLTYMFGLTWSGDCLRFGFGLFELYVVLVCLLFTAFCF